MLKDVTNRMSQARIPAGMGKGGLGASLRSLSSSMPRASKSGAVGSRQDPRPLTDKAWQRAGYEKVQAWLVAHNFDKQFTLKSVVNPSQSDFFALVEFVYSRAWAPSFRVANWPESVEAVLNLFKGLHYPFVLQKSALQSPNPHNWAQLFGALLWLVELAEADESVGMGPTTIRKKDDEDTVDQMWLNYLAGLYKVWMGPQAQAANKPALLAKLDADFKDKLQQQLGLYAEAVQEMEKQKEEAKKGLAQEEERLRAAAELNRSLEARLTELGTAIPSTHDQIGRLNREASELQQSLATKQFELDHYKEQLQATLAEKAQLEQAVAKQGFSTADREMLLREKAALEEQQTSLEQQREQKAREAAELEVSVSRTLDQVERKVQAHQERARKLGVFPVTAKHSGGENLEVSLGPSLVSTPAGEEQLKVTLKQVVRPGIMRLTAAYQEKRSAALDEQQHGDDSLERVKEPLNEAEQQAAKAEAELKQREATLAQAKDKADAEQKRQEAALRQLRQEASGLRADTEEQLRQATEAYELARQEESRAAEARRKEREEMAQQVMALNAALVGHNEALQQCFNTLSTESQNLLESATNKPRADDLTLSQQPPQQRRRAGTPCRRPAK